MEDVKNIASICLSVVMLICVIDMLVNHRKQRRQNQEMYDVWKREQEQARRDRDGDGDEWKGEDR